MGLNSLLTGALLPKLVLLVPKGMNSLPMGNRLMKTVLPVSNFQWG
jgi:hypothetical protein